MQIAHTSKSQMFPSGDTLGNVFSFLSTTQLITQMSLVCKDWKAVLQACPHAWGKTLDFRDVPYLIDFSYAIAWRRIVRLEYNSCWPDWVLCILSAFLDSLMEINFNSNKNITGRCLRYLQELPIVYLDFSECTQLSDRSIAALKGLRLKYLDLCLCSQITDLSVVKYISAFPLECLKLRCCSKISCDGLLQLKQSFKYVDFSGCHGIPKRSLTNLLYVKNIVIDSSMIDQTFLELLLRMSNVCMLRITIDHDSDSLYHYVKSNFPLYDCVRFSHVWGLVVLSITKRNLEPCQPIDFQPCVIDFQPCPIEFQTFMERWYVKV